MTHCFVRTLIVLSMLALSGEAIGQKRPDFSGTWAVVAPESSAGQTLTITQTADAVTLEYSSARGTEAVTYTLDDASTRRTIGTTIDGRRSTRTAQVISKASWKDTALVIEERHILDGRPMPPTKLVLSVDRTARLVLVHDRPLFVYSDTPTAFPEMRRKLVFVKR